MLEKANPDEKEIGGLKEEEKLEVVTGNEIGSLNKEEKVKMGGLDSAGAAGAVISCGTSSSSSGEANAGTTGESYFGDSALEEENVMVKTETPDDN